MPNCATERGLVSVSRNWIWSRLTDSAIGRPSLLTRTSPCTYMGSAEVCRPLGQRLRLSWPGVFYGDFGFVTSDPGNNSRGKPPSHATAVPPAHPSYWRTHQRLALLTDCPTWSADKATRNTAYGVVHCAPFQWQDSSDACLSMHVDPIEAFASVTALPCHRPARGNFSKSWPQGVLLLIIHDDQVLRIAVLKWICQSNIPLAERSQALPQQDKAYFCRVRAKFRSSASR